MSANPIDVWYSTDSKLKEVIDRIGSSGKSALDQAKEAFFELSELYGLHKYPDEITEEDYKNYEDEGIDSPRTVFEEVGIVRYLEPNDDPRGVVLFALYNVKNRGYVNIDDCAEKHFGKGKIPQSYVVYYTGQDAESKLNFLKEGESWTKEGVKYASKIISRKQ